MSGKPADESLDPAVMAVLAAVARVADAGGVRLPVRTLWEVTRYSLAMTKAEAAAGMDDSTMDSYARALMARERDLDGYFRPRPTKGRRR